MPVRKRNGTNELWCTIPLSLATKFFYQEQIHGMYWYTRKKRRGKKKNTKKEKKGKYTEKKENKKKESEVNKR